MKFSKIFALIGMLGVTDLAFAVSQTGISVTLAGTEGDGTQVYVGLSSNPWGCANGGIYFQQAGELDKTLAVALSAKALSRTVRIDFERNASTGICSGWSIYLE